MGGFAPAPAPGVMLAKREKEEARMADYAREQRDQRLLYVFRRLDTKGDEKIDAEELGHMLTQLGCEPRKKLRGDKELVLESLLHDVAAPEDMIWEVDEDGDDAVTWEEFSLCYERALSDETGNEPRKLFTLVEFLMLDEDEVNWVTVDSILHMMMMRHIDAERIIRAKFDDGTPGVRQINYSEFVAAGAPPSGITHRRRRV